MRSVLILDQGEVGLALALRAAQADWHVYYYLEDNDETNSAETGLGMHSNLEKVAEWLPYATKVDLVVPTQNDKFVEKLDMLRKRGVKVYAASAKAVELEIDRAKGMKWLEARGIKVPEWKSFKNLDQVSAYIKKNPDRYVIKPGGDCSDKSLSFVSKNVGQLLQQIERWKEQKVDFCGDIILQKFIKGIEFGVSSWVGTEGFIGYPCINFEHKPLMSGDIGPGTGEQGTISRYVKTDKLFRDLLEPIEHELVELEAFTDVDLNCIIAEDGTPYVLEFTMRPGMPIFNMQLFAHKGDPVQWMLDALNGEDTLKVSFDVMIGVVLTTGAYPFDSGVPELTEKAVGLPIYGIHDDNEAHVMPQAVCMGEFLDEDGEETVEGYVTTNSYVAVITDTGKTIEQARKKVYSIIDELDLSGLMYRNDIGQKVQKALPELKELGYAETWEEE